MRIKKVLPTLLGPHYVPVRQMANNRRGFVEPDVTLLSSFVDAGAEVVDVGAHRGAYTVPLHKLGARVLAIEPDWECYSVLQSWSKGRPNVCVVHAALSDRASISGLMVPVDESGVEHTAAARLETRDMWDGATNMVPTIPLDALYFSNLRFIKIDVEGHEMSVLRGSVEQIAMHRPVLLIEIEQRHCPFPVSETYSYVVNLGYEAGFVNEGQLKPIRSLSQFLEKANGSPRIFNFWFLPTERR